MHINQTTSVLSQLLNPTTFRTNHTTSNAFINKQPHLRAVLLIQPLVQVPHFRAQPFSNILNTINDTINLSSHNSEHSFGPVTIRARYLHRIIVSQPIDHSAFFTDETTSKLGRNDKSNAYFIVIQRDIREFRVFIFALRFSVVVFGGRAFVEVVRLGVAVPVIVFVIVVVAAFGHGGKWVFG